jgi:hypothetical protein
LGVLVEKKKEKKRVNIIPLRGGNSLKFFCTLYFVTRMKKLIIYILNLLVYIVKLVRGGIALFNIYLWAAAEPFPPQAPAPPATLMRGERSGRAPEPVFFISFVGGGGALPSSGSGSARHSYEGAAEPAERQSPRASISFWFYFYFWILW